MNILHTRAWAKPHYIGLQAPFMGQAPLLSKASLLGQAPLLSQAPLLGQAIWLNFMSRVTLTGVMG